MSLFVIYLIFVFIFGLLVAIFSKDGDTFITGMVMSIFWPLLLMFLSVALPIYLFIMVMCWINSFFRN